MFWDRFKIAVGLLGLSLFVLAAGCKVRAKSAVKGDEKLDECVNDRAIWACRMGIIFSDDSYGGLKVEQVVPIGFAHVVKIQPGSVLVRLNGEDVNSKDEFQRVAIDFSANKPQPWRFEFADGSTIKTECDPYELIECGPLPE